MNNTKRLLVIILLFVMVMAGAYYLYNTLLVGNTPDRLTTAEPPVTEDTQTETGADTAPPPQQAPDVTFYDLDGNAHQLSDYFGKPIVINFWASWCGPCKMEMPDFESKYQALGEEVQFLMVNMTMSSRESFDSAAGYVAEQGFTFPVFYDTDGTVMATYGVTSFPTTYFLDSQGNFVAYASGTLDAATLQQGIDMITE